MSIYIHLFIGGSNLASLIGGEVVGGARGRGYKVRSGLGTKGNGGRGDGAHARRCLRRERQILMS